MFLFRKANPIQQISDPRQDRAVEEPAEALPAGTQAPDFLLPSSTGGRLALRDLLGRPDVNPGAHGILNALENFAAGKR